MKCTIPEISWHNREPVLSIDIHPTSEKFYRLATGGADCHVLVWQLNICENGAVKIEALSDLTRHQKAVNSVRWAPGGLYLATADDDANIIIWQLKTDNIPLLEGETNDKETWIVQKVMRGHKEDIYDLYWSPDGQKLLSGSIDNTAILWDFAKGKSEHILTDHKGFVQGVSWDPKNHYVATISTDRICRIYESNCRQVKARIQRGYLPVPEDHYLHNKEVKFFHDDTFKSFFRRLDFSPDGTLLAVPSGRVEIEDCKKILYATYIFAVDSWAGPVAVLPSGKQCSTVARFCPILFELHEDGPDATVSLPFRMILAVGTDHDVILYDTQQAAPFAYFRDIHYTRLTDLTWSHDGLMLVASSTDGFCALITFEPNELGVQYVKEESEAEESVLNVSGCEELDKDENLNLSKEKIPEVVKPKKPNLLEQWTIKTPKRNKKPETIVADAESAKRKNQDKTVKRIKPIPVLSEKNPAESGIVEEKAKPKSSPMLNFLKKQPKNESRKNAPPLQTPILSEENEARDAWNCEKSEIKRSPEKNSMEIDEYTEDFSLHLEDTCESSKINENKVSSPLKEDEKRNDNEEQKPEKCQATNKRKENGDTEIEKDVKDCIESNTVPNDLEQSKVKGFPAKLENSSDLKSALPTKRRVPLITLSSPKHKKKGVSWDPKNHYVATISTDRICRIYESNCRQVKARIQRGYLPVPEDHYLHNKEVKFFHDDTFKSFFRRLDFSPDGTLLAVPSGRVEIEDCKKILYATYIFAVDSWAGPVAVLPSGKQCSTVARFCPILFELHEDGPDATVSLPFRMILAVGTDHDVILYDTQQAAPFAYFRDIHYTRLTDLTWSHDGLMLVASSTDGFCALITFEPNELGVQYVKEESEAEESVLNVSGCEELDKDENLDLSKEKIPEVVKPKKPNLLEQWTIKTPKRNKKPETIVADGESAKRKNQDKTVKRIKPIPVLSEKNPAESGIVEEKVKPKSSPMLNFLKKQPKNESRKNAPPLQTPILSEENEARDAWNCEKSEIKRSPEKNSMEIDEYTEDFSLHLEDTCESSKINENKMSSPLKEDEKRNDNEEQKPEKCQATNKRKENGDTEIEKNVKDCIESNTVPNDLEQSKVHGFPAKLENSSDLKSALPTKRRVPLITLSSPKHKKK